MERMMKEGFMDFKTFKRNSLFHCKYSGLKECSSTKLVSMVISSLFSHGDKHCFTK